MFSCETEYRSLANELEQQTKKATLILCDEFDWLSDGRHPHLDCLQADQNCIFFTSHTYWKEIPQFDKLHLSASLRSTGEISRFAARWRECSRVREFDWRLGHNFEGERVEVQIIQKLEMEPNSHRQYSHFTSKCATLIKQTADNLADDGVLPVICFMSDALQDMLFSAFIIMFPNQLCIRRTENMNHLSGNHGPLIRLFRPHEVAGMEFGAVFILFSYMHVADFDFAHNEFFFTAITRASTKLTIIASDLQLSDCRMLKNDPKDDLQECCLTDEWQNSTLQQHIAAAGAINENLSVLLVGYEPSLASFQKRKYEASGLSIEGVTEYVGVKGSFLHVEDVADTKSLETFQNLGIKVIYVATVRVQGRMQDRFYQITHRLIEAFFKKQENPFRIFFLGDKNGNMDEFLSFLKFVLSESGKGSTFTSIDCDTERNYSDILYQIRSDISWRKWKPKADALFRVGEMDLSLIAYSFAFESLKKEHLLAKQSSSLSQVVETMKEAAKVLADVSLVYLKLPPIESSIHPIEKLVPFCLDFNDLQPFQCHLMKALLFAMYATKWNVCWFESYDRIGAAVQKLSFTAHIQMIEEDKKAPTDTLNKRMKNLIKEDKLLKEPVRFWDASILKIGTFFYADIEPKLKEFTQAVSNYKEGLDSATIEELISLRKKVSDVLEELQKCSGDVRKKILDERADREDAIHKLRLEADIVLKSEILFGTYAVRWNPTNVKNYQTLLASLEKFETVVNQLSVETKRLSQYLEVIAKKEMSSKKRNFVGI